MFMSRSTSAISRHRLRGLAPVGAALLTLAFAQRPARAQEEYGTESTATESTATESTPAKKESFYQLTVGGKLGVGGNFLPAPDDPPAGGSQPFDDGVGGWGIGGGIFSEVRFFDGHLGAELDLLIDSSHNWSKLTINTTDYKLGWAATDLRMPILINAGTSNKGTRLAFGTGPEFVFALGADGKSEVASGPNFPFPNFDAKGKTHTNWAFNAGLGLPIGPVRVTFDVRFSLNLQSQSKYADRFENTLPPSVVAMHRMDLRLLIGVAYDVIR
jgi:hypothetical protein